MKILRWIVGALAILMLVSCKIRIVVPEGGSVTTQSGAYSCASGRTCNIDVVDFYFDQTFVAKPANGYTFKFWKKADRRFCGGDPKPCQLATKGLNANDVLRPVMLSFFAAADEVFFLQPVFEKTGATASSCSVYAGNSQYCAEGRIPTCPISLEQTYQISPGMTYDEVVKLVGCHGQLMAYAPLYGNVTVANYQWREGSRVVTVIQFRATGSGAPKVYTVAQSSS